MSLIFQSDTTPGELFLLVRPSRNSDIRPLGLH
jgi:hypothetical protein